jgi:hypothetical protein
MAVGYDPKIPVLDGMIDRVLFRLWRLGLSIGRYSITAAKGNKRMNVMCDTKCWGLPLGFSRADEDDRWVWCISVGPFHFYSLREGC